MKRKKRTPDSEESGRTRKQLDEDSWREPLEAIAINDDEWWCIVTMMVETIPDHSRCVSIFNEAADMGRRKAIHCLSYQKTLSSIRALSKQSFDKYPAIQGVCHHASKILDAGEIEALPSWLMARIIKYLIYRAREESIGRVKRLANLEREIDEEYWIMQTVADWGQPGSKKFDASIFDKKANTKLRKRDEEWRDAVYVDDAPLNGPNLYIILTGFHDPDLPTDLRNAGVPLHCMMQIKRPSEKLDRLERCSIVEETESRKLYFLEEYSVSKIKLFNFWSKVEKRLTEPEEYPEYSDIGFLVFCPPQLPDTSRDDEYTALRKDLYDRVSYIVYDFYDLYRQHGNYLKSMKVEKSIVAENASSPNMDIYDVFLNAFPLECISVPIILFAILTQVEANERMAAEDSMDEKGDARASQKSEIEIPVEIEETKETPASLVEQKVKTLDIKFGLDREGFDTENARKSIEDIELVLYGDILNKAVHVLDDCAISQALKPTDLAELILTIYRHPISTIIRKEHQIPEKRLNQYTRHLNRIQHYFDAKLSDEEIRHYLHMLVFDGMIFGSSEPTRTDTSRTTLTEKPEDIAYNGERYSVRRCKSLPSLSSKSRPDVHFLSDGNIDYGLIIPEIISCSALFDLIDPRELLVPGYLEKNVFGKRATGKLRLEDFSDAELLSRPIFLQLLHECLLAFDRVELRYFEPTDSLLLYFSNKWRINGVHEEERMSSIRTPVQLRDFCKYVVPEEEDWLRREEELYRLQTAEWMERLMRQSSEIYEETMVFRDEDFILPGTLKAKDLEKGRELDRQKAKLEGEASVEPSVKADTKNKRKVKEKGNKTPKKNRRGNKLVNEKASSARSSLEEVTPVTTKRWSIGPEIEKEPVYDFIGYDIGTLRVQVTNHKKTFFSADNTLVQVEMDHWLYNSKDLRITVSLRGYTLRLFHRVDKPQANKMFHLTSRTGIILAFQKLVTTSRTSKIPYQDWQEMNIELRASWPTGLIIESVLGDGPQNPYYIQQSYTPKGYDDTDGNREVCRKFLRNGTLLKYLDDGRIIVFRPNGVIVTCTEFITFQPKQREDYGDQASIFRSAQVYSSGDKTREPRHLPRNKRKWTNNSKPELHGEAYGDNGQRQPTTNQDVDDDVSSLADGTARVSRYTVVNHDGGRYEVLDDLIVSEQHRLLVRMASDYEVDEKFTRRADGTNMLLNSNGELIVRFPDGTRITTGYRIEEEPVTCDWTEEEILRYFTTDGTKEYEEQYVETSSASLRYNEESSSSRRNTEYEEKVNELLIAESFVSVLLTCRMEHKNYTTVSYDQSAVNCTLSMPDDLRVSISGRDHYEVSMADGVNLKIDEDGLSFKGNACALCGSQSTSIYNFHPFDQSAVIFTTVDVFGNTFEVRNDGTTWYYPNSEEKLSTDTDGLNEGGEYCEEFEGEETVRPPCNHERLNFESSGIHYRIFSLNQDLTAYEYIHRCTRNQTELMALYDKETSMFLYPSPHRAELRRLITCEPIGAESRLRDALSFPDYQLKPTNFDRRDILRSTYSIPYDWLFPFGRNGNGIQENTHDLPLIEDVKALPRLLRVRILRGFKQPGRNAIIDLQQALGNYWISLVRSTFQSHVDREESPEREEATKTVHDRMEDKLQLLSLGIKKTIDVETYNMGLEKEWKTAKPKTQGMAFERFLGHKTMEKEVLDWYKRCMREKYILPYFENITGTCFLWIMDCMTTALKVSVSGEWDGEIGESQKF